MKLRRIEKPALSLAHQPVNQTGFDVAVLLKLGGERPQEWIAVFRTPGLAAVITADNSSSSSVIMVSSQYRRHAGESR